MSDDVIPTNNAAKVEASAVRKYTRDELKAFVAEVARRVVESNASYMHSMLAIDHILRLPNAQEVLDEELKEELRDIWLKLKSMGLQLNDPPLLFGLGSFPQDAEGLDDMNEGDSDFEGKSGSPASS